MTPPLTPLDAELLAVSQDTGIVVDAMKRSRSYSAVKARAEFFRRATAIGYSAREIADTVGQTHAAVAAQLRKLRAA